MDDSMFAPKIGTNYTPTEQELSQLKGLLLEPTERLAKLEQEMNQVLSTYNEVLDQHDLLARKILDYRALMAPFGRLPVDLIQEIFLHSLPTEHYPLMSRHECPILLTQVCSKWRQIAQSTPSLWASIHIAIPRNSTTWPTYSQPSSDTTVATTCRKFAESRAVGVEEWLGRSGECLLNISIRDPGYHAMAVDESYGKIIDFLIAVSHRWARLTLNIHYSSLERFAALPASAVPMLQSLTIADKHTRTYWILSEPDLTLCDNSWKCGGLLKGPLLREVLYHQDTADFVNFPLRWSQLTKLSLNLLKTNQDVPFSKLFDILRSCPALISCVLDINRFHAPDAFVVMSPVSLPDLRVFSIRCRPRNLCSVLSILDVPSLRDLEFDYDPPAPFDFFADHALPFLARISYTLQKLDLNPLVFTTSQFFRCLRVCSYLTTLSLSHARTSVIGWSSSHTTEGTGYVVEDSLLRALTKPEHDNKLLLPNLTVLESSAAVNLSDPAILQFIREKRSGIPGVAPLKHISIILHRPQTIPMANDLWPYINDGLQCDLTYTLDIPSPVSAYDGIPEPHTDARTCWLQLLQF